MVAVLDLIGQFLGTPFSWAWIGKILLRGCCLDYARMLGSTSMAQMLGLTARSNCGNFYVADEFAGRNRPGNVPALGRAESGIVRVGLWSAVIYVKATAVAQRFTIWRSIGRIYWVWAGGVVFAIAAVSGYSSISNLFNKSQKFSKPKGFGSFFVFLLFLGKRRAPFASQCHDQRGTVLSNPHGITQTCMFSQTKQIRCNEIHISP